MDLKQTILALLSREALIDLCRVFAVETDGLRQEVMASCFMRRESISAAQVLEHLTESAVKAVGEACGIGSTGRKATLIKKLLRQAQGPTFVAIDFETADYGPDSACALGLVRVENHQIVQRSYSLIKPPRRRFVFTYLHGITWEDVARQPSFAEVWPTVTPLLEGIDFLAAHNASFDRAVLQRCCEAAGLESPQTPFQCTVRLARQTWNIYPTKLNNVCDHLGITLKHHHAAADAEACALIVIAAHQSASAAKDSK
jgi:DNA polymerase III subunit epsilon